MNAWEKLNRRIVNCIACPRLREHCASVATAKRAAYVDFEYWGKPVPNFGDPSARLLVVGLAPGAHGANRTGRVFTGDRSGEFLFRAMHDTGFASQPNSLHRSDGMRLIDCAITGVAHCAPPGNKPMPDELANCRAFFDETIRLMPNLRVMLALGRIAFDASVRWHEVSGRDRPPFGHGAIWQPGNGKPTLVASFHPSQQNTFTGRLTPKMMRDVFEVCRVEIEKTPPARDRAGGAMRL